MSTWRLLVTMTILYTALCLQVFASDLSRANKYIRKDTPTQPPLHVRGDNNYPPYEYLNEQGQPEGFNIDIIRAIAEAMGMRIRIDLGPWDEVREELENQKIDALLGMFQTEERDKLVDFSIPHFIASYAVFVREGSPIESIEDARGKRILVQLSDLGHDYIKEQKITDHIIGKRAWSEVLQALGRGEGDCAVVSRLQGTRLLGQLGISGIKAVGGPIIQRKYCLAVHEGNSALLAQLNESLSIIKDTGEYDRIYDKWFGVYDQQEYGIGHYLRVVVLVAAPLLLLAVVGFFWSWILQKQVKRRTQDLDNELLERKRAEDELQRREEQLQKIFEILPIGLWVTDKDGRLLRSNPLGQAIWGAEADCLPDQQPNLKAWRLPERTLLKADDWGVTKTLRGGATIVDELLEIETFDGKRKTILYYSTPVVDDKGMVDGAIVVNLDISERENLEQRLIQAQKMESIGQLAGGVAHDFNNMLSVILGHAEMALEITEGQKPLYTYLQHIREAAQRSADLTRQLLTFARRQTVAPKLLELNEVVGGMLQMLRRLIGEDIDLIWRPGASVGAVRIDPSQLDQVLVNLCINARDAIKDVGKIIIETDSIFLDEEFCAGHHGLVPGDYVLLAVADDGCGIKADTMPHLFEPFFTTKESDKGTGLGLATVYGIVKQNNGLISAYSEPGQGAVFKIYLPRHLEGVAGKTKSTVHQSALVGDETVLLVEDEPLILEMTSIMLKQLGYNVLAAAAPAKAIAIAIAQQHSERIHLLLTDIIMPGMNGRELAKQLQILHPGLKCLYMSGYTSNVIAHRGVLEDGVFFISKPFVQEELARKLRETLTAACENLPNFQTIS